ncbi:hypothetical protein Ancab_023065 [Ancistrocladus abbreviatus]
MLDVGCGLFFFLLVPSSFAVFCSFLAAQIPLRCCRFVVVMLAGAVFGVVGQAVELCLMCLMELCWLFFGVLVWPFFLFHPALVGVGFSHLVPAGVFSFLSSLLTPTPPSGRGFSCFCGS